MEVFLHHIYEYHKGLRSLILHTMAATHQAQMKERLNREGIAYRVYPLGKSRINVFFGARECVAVIESIGKSSLSDYTPEEDFILGVMLGYSRLQQCERYLRMVEKKAEIKMAEPFGKDFSTEPERSRVTELSAWRGRAGNADAESAHGKQPAEPRIVVP